MPFIENAPDVFCWTDTCNVWVIREGTAAILIDLGDASVLAALPRIGVTSVEWVLFTHTTTVSSARASRNSPDT
ncbi:MAG: MBL fold metallo-hydrolase [Pirellulales bacterium]